MRLVPGRSARFLLFVVIAAAAALSSNADLPRTPALAQTPPPQIANGDVIIGGRISASGTNYHTRFDSLGMLLHETTGAG